MHTSTCVSGVATMQIKSLFCLQYSLHVFTSDVASLLPLPLSTCYYCVTMHSLFLWWSRIKKRMNEFFIGNFCRLTQLFKEMFQRWRAVGTTVFDLTRPRFKPQTSHSKRRTKYHLTSWPYREHNQMHRLNALEHKAQVEFLKN